MYEKINWNGSCTNDEVRQDIEKFVLIYIDSNVEPLPPNSLNALGLYDCIRRLRELEEDQVISDSEEYKKAKAWLDPHLGTAAEWLKKGRESVDVPERITPEYIKNDDNLPKFDLYVIDCSEWGDAAILNTMGLKGYYGELEYKIGELWIFDKEWSFAEIFEGEEYPKSETPIRFSKGMLPTRNVGIKNVTKGNSGGFSDFFDPTLGEIPAEYEVVE
ncbi:MAG: hypothetical protein ACP5E4_02015 [Candidatus Aenigmatarchaeota archaeon]